MSEAWGFHLIVDAGDCLPVINDTLTIKSFLKKLVEVLRMEALGAPVVYYVDTPEGKGVSACQFITTSTITFHGDNDGLKAFIDVFSCKEYNVDDVLKLIKQWFSPLVLKHRYILRDASNPEQT